MMPHNYRILSFHYITNNGAFLFTYCLTKLFRQNFGADQVKVLDYRSPRLVMIEFMKRFRLLKRLPLFYWKRSQVWNRVLNQHLDLDQEYPRFSRDKKIQRFISDHFDAVIVGMDVWCLVKGTERPLFPNIYWLPEKMEAIKIAYGVSGYNSDPDLILKYQPEISAYLNDFDVIGVRDRFTEDLVARHRTNKTGLISRVPDPTFLYEIRPTGVKDKLSQLGVDFDRPIVGVLLFGQDTLSRAIRDHFKAKGCQIVALSMYNSHADFNLGHVLDPFEWAETFQYLSFCITDRFHGTIFCLKNEIPFISLEKDAHLPRFQSKIFDLLSDFDLIPCYADPQGENFTISGFLNQADAVEANWEKAFKPYLSPKITLIQESHRDFIGRIKTELELG